jgi:NADP-dependent 3-hydroxy acid dehydrogenase YdfG
VIDLNIKGVLYGIAAALPVFRKQGFGHSFSTASTSGHKTEPSQSVYSGTKFAVRAISEGLRQEAGDKAAGDDNFAALSPDELRRRCDKPQVKAQLTDSRNQSAMPPEAIARAIAFASELPPILT